MTFTISSSQKSTQRDRMLALLRGGAGSWVPLPDILRLGIAQYNARIYELRRLGHCIESKQEGDQSWFRLTKPSASIAKPSNGENVEVTERPEALRLFPDDAPLRHRDLG